MPTRCAVLQVVAYELDVVLAVTRHWRRGNEPHQCAQPNHDERQRSHQSHNAEGYLRPTAVRPGRSPGVLTGAAHEAGSIVERVAAILRSGGGGRSGRLTLSARWR